MPHNDKLSHRQINKSHKLRDVHESPSRSSKTNYHRSLGRVKRGFTIVEVTLVSAFVAMLLIAIAVITMNISSLFQKGLTMRAINSVGRNLVDEFTTSINSAPSIDSTSLCNTLVQEGNPRTECLQNGAFRYIYQDLTNRMYGDNYVDDVTGEMFVGLEEAIQYAGVFCTGNYSYIWNTYYGAHNSSNRTITLKYRKPNMAEHEPDIYYNIDPNTNEPFKLIRFVDKTYRACSSIVTPQYLLNQNFIDGKNDSNALGQHVVDMTHLANNNSYVMEIEDGFLDDSDVPLDLYEFTIFPVSQDTVTLRAFMSGTFILATTEGNVSITRSGDYCDVNVHTESSTTGDLGSHFNYCGINKFNFAARTAGSGI